MKEFSNRYVLLFSVVTVVSVAVSLSVASVALKERQEKNIAMETKRNILSALGVTSAADDAETLFAQYVRAELVIDRNGGTVAGKGFAEADTAQGEYPLYIADMQGEPVYILPLAGKGLWGRIWGYAALKADRNTIFGVTFSHAGETPGLGAEIASAGFQQQFRGKMIFDGKEDFTGIRVLKAGTYTPDVHSVDAVSGGTITSNALREMIFHSLLPYRSFLKSKQ